QEMLLHIGSFFLRHGLVEQWSNIAPDFAPHFRSGAPKRPRMLAADDGLVGIVVEVGEILAPADPDRLLPGQHHSPAPSYAVRPLLRTPDGSGFPIVCRHELSEFTLPQK